MYEQAVIPVENAQQFGAVKQAVDAAFSSSKVDDFLRALKSAKLRIRDFEDVLKAGKLGSTTGSDYARLGNGDQGMIRELYLSLLEKVDPELRRKYLKVYAYY
ncbi:hypothetical protein [Terriglobus saanensis]|uniref:Uncharacterized protein n=1 Tax=Terriglobus saanensis (strain ATCC BAA-1853 / DSM 23119 / SP1PR4) TaxID=401053 RepID=E8UXH7_TERSS|nr:hypothetical protein [Terriglobus saanensis]ADV84201.1 hypothetical protein AciPR4_3447 [Terriglobus saanensis SP1PR4]